MTISNHEFTDAIVARRRAEAIVVPHIVGGREILEGDMISREDPSLPHSLVSRCHEAPQAVVCDAVESSRKAQRDWAALSVSERLDRMRPAIPYVESVLDEWAVRVALEIGKGRGPAHAEAREVLDILKLYLGYAEEPGAFIDERQNRSSGIVNVSLLRPYGVFGVIVPFNYPIVQAANAVIAALIAGNGAVVKTSHHGPWSGQAVQQMCDAMDLPVGLVNTIHGADAAGRHLVDAGLDGICFTGSVGVGSAIMRQFLDGGYPRPVIAEMGGKNPVIVTGGADLEAAADGIIFSAFDLSGQKCSALSRVLATPAVYQQLVRLVEERAGTLIIAEPLVDNAFAGPLVDAHALAKYEGLVAEAISGGFAVAGGARLGKEGYFVQPAVVSRIPADHKLSTTEHFVPFLTISEVPDLDAALASANASSMGLSAGIYTGDPNEADLFLDRIEAGCVNVNVPGHATTGWWPGPQTFGGWKASGSSGKQAHGRWYVQQFARQQCRKLPAEWEAQLKC